MDMKQHWEQVYATKASDNVSWFQQQAYLSLALIHQTAVAKDAAIIDVGAGASNLVDGLAAERYTNLSVLDLSSAALDVAKQRLGKHAEAVHWIVGDITKTSIPVNYFDIWHDRAVFHFLTDPTYRQAYVEQVKRSVRAHGHVIIATFSEDGPEKCSGLPVIRYSPKTLHAELGNDFLLVKQEKEAHHTPSGSIQQFVYCCFQYSPK